jgi:membrane-associated phospholipid phosphatase
MKFFCGMSNFFKRFLAALALISLELIVMAGVALVCVLVFLFMAKTVFIDQDHSFDRAAFAFAGSHTTPDFTAFMKFVTFFASKDFLIYGSLGLAAFFLFFKKHRWYSLKIPVVAAGSTLLNQGMKFWFGRPRPDTAFLEQSGLSFPSGHAMIGGAFYGLLIYLVWTTVRPLGLRWLLVTLLGLWVLLIGYSRVYLHVHYASDVLAGWAAGFLFLVFALLILRRLEPRYAEEAEEIMAQDQPNHSARP